MKELEEMFNNKTYTKNEKTFNLSKSSIKNYMGNLKLLNNSQDFNNLTFLKNKKNILNFIGDKSPKTQLNYLSAIINALKFFDKHKDLYNYYKRELEELSSNIRNGTSNEKTDTQKDNWLDYDEILKVYNNLKDEAEKIFKKSKLNKNEYNKILDYMVLSLYILLPPRRNTDFIKMKILKNKKDKYDDKDYNYLDLVNQQFIFQYFKNSKLLDEPLKIDIPDDLFNIIKKYLKYNKSDRFLVDHNSKPYQTSAQITKILNRIFGKKISSSMLRHIYLSDKYKDTLDERKKDSVLMSHSKNMQDEYIKK
jgi:hypothetical protein